MISDPTYNVEFRGGIWDGKRAYYADLAHMFLVRVHNVKTETRHVATYKLTDAVDIDKSDGPRYVYELQAD